MAIKECKTKFRKERWDCSTVNAPLALPLVFGGVPQGGLAPMYSQLKLTMAPS